MRVSVLAKGGTTVFNGVSTGDIIKKLTTVPTSGFLRCSGGYVDKTTYSGLFAIIGNSFDSYVGAVPNGSGKPWKQQYDINTTQIADITGWAAATSLPVQIADSQAIVTKNRVYLLGGSNGVNAMNTIYSAPINPDGTLGVWALTGYLPSPTAGHQAIVTRNRVYLLGARNYSYIGDKSVYTSPINPDGTLGTWTKWRDLPGESFLGQAIVTKNRVYLLIGGPTWISAAPTVYSANIDPDGTLGLWAIAGDLPGALTNSQAVVTNGRVYLLGGYNGTTDVTTVYTATINPDGTLGTWGIGTPLPGPLSNSQAIVTKNRVYLLGGRIGVLDTGTVYTAPINPDGTLGIWAAGTSLPTALILSQVIVTSSRVYLLGGYTLGSYVSTVYSAPFLGGLNDYSPYYVAISTNPSPATKFGLPYTADFDSVTPGAYSYIKT